MTDLSFDQVMESLRERGSDALADLESFAHAYPDHHAAWAHLTWNLFSLGYPQNADEAIQHLKTLLPDSSETHHLQARIHDFFERSDLVLQSYDKAIRLAPDPSLLGQEMIQYDLMSGRPWSALFRILYYKALIRIPIQLPTRVLKFLATDLCLSTAAKIPGAISLLLSPMYIRYVRRAHRQKALRIALACASASRSDGQWDQRVADCLYDLRDCFFPGYDHEIRWRKRAFRKGIPQSREHLARVLVQASFPREALNLYVDQPPRSAAEHAVCGHAHTAARQVEQAIEHYSMAAADDAMQGVNCGIIHLMQNRWQEGQACFSGATSSQEFLPLALGLAPWSVQPPSADAFDETLQRRASQNGWDNHLAETRTDWEALQNQLLETGRYQSASCPLCNATNDAPFYVDPVSGWVRVRCQTCTCHYVNPQPKPETIPSLYNHEQSQTSSLKQYFKQTLQNNLAMPDEETARLFLCNERWWTPEFDLERFEQQRGPSRRYLDIGCSVGTLLHQFTCRGWNSVGLDFDEDAIRIACEAGFDARQTSVEDSRLEKASFDYITLMDVIEHVLQPGALVQTIFDLLKPGGVLKIKTPCVDSLPYYQYGRQWTSSDTHLIYFSRKTLAGLLRDKGFEIVATRSYLEANKLHHTYNRWRSFSITPVFDRLVMDLDIGDTILVLARKPESSIQGE